MKDYAHLSRKRIVSLLQICKKTDVLIKAGNYIASSYIISSPFTPLNAVGGILWLLNLNLQLLLQHFYFLVTVTQSDMHFSDNLPESHTTEYSSKVIPYIVIKASTIASAWQLEYKKLILREFKLQQFPRFASFIMLASFHIKWET